MGRAKTIRLDVKLKLLHDYHHNDGDTVAILAERYSMHPNTVMRIIRNESLLLGKKSLATTDEEEHHGKNINDETSNVVDQQTTTLERSKQRKRRKFSKSNDSNQRKESINGESTNQQQQSLSKKNPNDSENSEIDETERIMAMKRFFDYIDRIEDIVLRYDYDYNRAFQFTRDLNQSTLRYRHMLYEMEKRQLIRTNRWNKSDDIDHSNLQSSSSNHNGQQGLDDDNSKDISKKFRYVFSNENFSKICKQKSLSLQ